MQQKDNKSLLYGGIFFLTCGTLVFEISLIRIFSVAQWYHFAFLVVSIAMLGLGAAGSFLTFFPEWQRRISSNHLSNLAFFFTISVVSAYAITNHIPFDQRRIALDLFQFVYLLLYYCLLAIPPFFAGLILSSLYTKYSQRIGKFYFFDLLGAAVGSVAVLQVNSMANGLGGIWVAALCGLISSSFFSPSTRKGMLKLAFVILLAGIWLVDPSIFSIKMSEYKALPQLLRPPDSQILQTKWTPLARIDFVRSPFVHFAPGLSLRSYADLPEQIGIVVDGDNLNALTRFEGNPKTLEFLDNLPSALPYYLSKINSVLVFEPLGGLDLLTALYYGSPTIEGVGVYNEIAEIATENFNVQEIFSKNEDHVTAGLFKT